MRTAQSSASCCEVVEVHPATATVVPHQGSGAPKGMLALMNLKLKKEAGSGFSALRLENGFGPQGQFKILSQ